jgi:hypothetical protein
MGSALSGTEGVMVRRVMRDVKERCAEVVAADKKAIQSLRLGLRDGLRQSGMQVLTD